MVGQDQLSNQKLETLALYIQIYGFRKLETSLRRLNIAILCVFAIVIVVFPNVFIAVFSAYRKCGGPWGPQGGCGGPGRPPINFSGPLFLVLMLSAILLTLIIIAVMTQNRLKKKKRNVGKETSSSVSNNRQPSVIVSSGNINSTALQVGYDLRVNLVRTWISEDTAFRDALATLILNNPDIDRIKYHENDIIQQLDRRILDLEKQQAGMMKQSNSWKSRFPVWTTVTYNIVYIIVLVPAIVGGVISFLLALLR